MKRREFLEVAVKAALGAAAFGLLGCGGDAGPTVPERPPTELLAELGTLGLEVNVSPIAREGLLTNELSSILSGMLFTMQDASQALDLKGKLRPVNLKLGSEVENWDGQGASTRVNFYSQDPITLVFNIDSYRSLRDHQLELKSSGAHEVVHIIARSSTPQPQDYSFSRSFKIVWHSGLTGIGENLNPSDVQTRLLDDNGLAYEVDPLEELFANQIEQKVNPAALSSTDPKYSVAMPLFEEFRTDYNDLDMWRILWNSEPERLALNQDITSQAMWLAFLRLERADHTYDEARAMLNLPGN